MLEQAIAALVDRLDRLIGFDFNKDPGRGNLNLRAYIASILGPRRVAHGSRAVKQVPFDRAVLIAKNQPSGHQCMYVECWMPGPIPAGLSEGIFRFSSSEDAGVTSVFNLVSATHITTYSAVLLPNEQLYAQAAEFAGGPPVPATLPLVVSTVAF